MERIAYTVDEVIEIVGIGRTKLYEAIRSGELPIRKIGRRTLIRAIDLYAWLDELPTKKESLEASMRARGGI